MSVIKQEVAGLVGAYIRAWFYGGLIGAGLAVWAMSSGGVDLHSKPVQQQQCQSSMELPCMDAACLDAWGYTIALPKP